MKKIKVIKAKKSGQHDISYHPGGLHESLGVAKGKPIPSAAFHAALSGSKGEKAKKQALMAKNVFNVKK
jgi:hypothetical protein